MAAEEDHTTQSQPAEDVTRPHDWGQGIKSFMETLEKLLDDAASALGLELSTLNLTLPPKTKDGAYAWLCARLPKTLVDEYNGADLVQPLLLWASAEALKARMTTNSDSTSTGAASATVVDLTVPAGAPPAASGAGGPPVGRGPSPTVPSLDPRLHPHGALFPPFSMYGGGIPYWPGAPMPPASSALGPWPVERMLFPAENPEGESSKKLRIVLRVVEEMGGSGSPGGWRQQLSTVVAGRQLTRSDKLALAELRWTSVPAEHLAMRGSRVGPEAVHVLAELVSVLDSSWTGLARCHWTQAVLRSVSFVTSGITEVVTEIWTSVGEAAEVLYGAAESGELDGSACARFRESIGGLALQAGLLAVSVSVRPATRERSGRRGAPATQQQQRVRDRVSESVFEKFKDAGISLAAVLDGVKPRIGQGRPLHAGERLMEAVPALTEAERREVEEARRSTAGSRA